ncbi:DUF3850 domain-containing protein [Lactococcus sp. DD01]|uniref:DUF3850 domain-containing protein n=1 Tax=Lactococcus sp. DD01 TaxID=1776443 RepID=UPI000776536F|nr:DUF3850 domain-containing protein [Lactococcus sp. DD01]KXT63177.1 hypothetical protein LACDD01_00159 [Lactococcus sp. DD01]
MKTHELKLDVKYFDEVKNGTKNFEIRKNDRDFKVGDILILKAFMPGLKTFVKWGEIINPLNDYRMSHNYMSCAEKEADTIKVKIVEIMSWDQLSEPDDEKSMFSFETVNSQIQQVLKDYFKADRLPKGFAILGIEVVK